LYDKIIVVRRSDIMKINLNRLYVGDIMVGASTLTKNNIFSDRLIISKKD